MRAKATKARAAQNMEKRAERLLSGLEDQRAQRPGGQAAVPRARRRAAARRCTAPELSKSYGSLEVFTDVDLAIDRGAQGGHPGPQRRRQDHAAAHPGRGRGPRTPARCVPGHGLRLGYYAQEHDTLDPPPRCSTTCCSAADLDAPPSAAESSGQFLFTGDDVDKPARVLSGGEKTRLALATLVVSAGQRPAARRADEQPRPGQPGGGSRRAGTYKGAVVLVTHDEGAVQALAPEKVLLAARRASRTCGARTTWTSSRWPEHLDLVAPTGTALTPDAVGRRIVRCQDAILKPSRHSWFTER